MDTQSRIPKSGSESTIAETLSSYVLGSASINISPAITGLSISSYFSHSRTEQGCCSPPPPALSPASLSPNHHSNSNSNLPPSPSASPPIIVAETAIRLCNTQGSGNSSHSDTNRYPPKLISMANTLATVSASRCASISGVRVDIPKHYTSSCSSTSTSSSSSSTSDSLLDPRTSKVMCNGLSNNLPILEKMALDLNSGGVIRSITVPEQAVDLALKANPNELQQQVTQNSHDEKVMDETAENIAYASNSLTKGGKRKAINVGKRKNAKRSKAAKYRKEDSDSDFEFLPGKTISRLKKVGGISGRISTGESLMQRIKAKTKTRHSHCYVE
ncbi:unnamed protein product [Protopolystoma xenopodis]|uniref:Uncharacterized protein n=1 Tax=Protopolystoma xenopodis TaxID=117903 RepID=A0A448X3N0_9PLAT|nr:unnamed protein product [Protopolystoma xenopodis]